MSVINDVLAQLKVKSTEREIIEKHDAEKKKEQDTVRSRPILGGGERFDAKGFEKNLPEPIVNPNVGSHHDPYSKPPKAERKREFDRNLEFGRRDNRHYNDRKNDRYNDRRNTVNFHQFM